MACKELARFQAKEFNYLLKRNSEIIRICYLMILQPLKRLLIRGIEMS